MMSLECVLSQGCHPGLAATGVRSKQTQKHLLSYLKRQDYWLSVSNFCCLPLKRRILLTLCCFDSPSAEYQIFFFVFCWLGFSIYWNQWIRLVFGGAEAQTPPPLDDLKLEVNVISALRQINRRLWYTLKKASRFTHAFYFLLLYWTKWGIEERWLRQGFEVGRVRVLLWDSCQKAVQGWEEAEEVSAGTSGLLQHLWVLPPAFPPLSNVQQHSDCLEKSLSAWKNSNYVELKLLSLITRVCL